MNKLELHDELHAAWQRAKRNWESAHEEIDAIMRQYCEGKGPAPNCRKMDEVDDLLYLMCEARGELDHFIREHADATECTESEDNLVDKDSNSSGRAVDDMPPV